MHLQKQNKLSRQYFGPFQVLKCIGEVAYKLDLPASSRIHPTFHVSVLRKCIGAPDQQVTPLELLDQSSALVLMPESILQQRVLHKGNGQLVQWLIKWSGLPDATWEAKSTILQQFPQLNLEDKVSLQGVGNVMNMVNDPLTLRRSNRLKSAPKYLEEYSTTGTNKGTNVSDMPKATDHLIGFLSKQQSL